MKKRVLSILLAAVMLIALLPQPQEVQAHEIVMTAEEFIDCLWTAYSRPNYYYNSYPYNLGYYDGSRISFDCWNLGKAIIWTKGAIVNNYTVGAYAAMDASCGLGDWDGYEIIKAAVHLSLYKKPPGFFREVFYMPPSGAAVPTKGKTSDLCRKPKVKVLSNCICIINNK